MFITEWVLNIKEIEAKCPILCKNVARPDKCTEHRNGRPDILGCFADRANYLIEKFKHTNLIRYLDITLDQIDEDKYVIYVAQEHIIGACIGKLCENENSVVDISEVARAVLPSIKLLHESDISHGYLFEKSIFFDESATCRLADFDLIPYLMYLKGTNNDIHKMSDFDALGSIVDRLDHYKNATSRDFIAKCRSGKVLSYEVLSNHPFISKKRFANNNRKSSDSKNDSIEHFDIIKKLGAGSFGTVYQAKHLTDHQSYAIKLIKCSKNKKEYEQMEREAEIISGIQHKHVIKYHGSWKQMIDMSELEKFNDDSDDELELDWTGSTHSSLPLKGPTHAMMIQMELCMYNLR